MGVSGFPCIRYLMTPYNVPTTNECSLMSNRVSYRTHIRHFLFIMAFAAHQSKLSVISLHILYYIIFFINRSDIFINSNCIDLDIVQCINNEKFVSQKNYGYRIKNETAHIYMQKVIRNSIWISNTLFFYKAMKKINVNNLLFSTMLWACIHAMPCKHVSL